MSARGQAQASDVSAVLLSVGEPYLQDAIAALQAQSHPVREVVIVEQVAPFVRALNEGIRRVATPFFVQVDADMVLDPECVAIMRDRIRDDTGMVVAELRDALEGQLVGIKLFRTACFDKAPVADTVSLETDLMASLERRGWKVVYVDDAGAGPVRPTVGEHRPDYTPSYTFRRFRRMGAKLRYRAARGGLVYQFGQLERSRHPRAVLAQLALAHGFFCRIVRDDLTPPERDEHAEMLAVLLDDGRPDRLPTGALAFDVEGRLRTVFRRTLAVGRSLAADGDGAGITAVVKACRSTGPDGFRGLVAKMALAHGVLGGSQSAQADRRAERMVEDLVVFGLGSQASAAQRAAARLWRLVRRSRGRPTW